MKKRECRLNVFTWAMIGAIVILVIATGLELRKDQFLEATSPGNCDCTHGYVPVGTDVTTSLVLTNITISGGRKTGSIDGYCENQVGCTTPPPDGVNCVAYLEIDVTVTGPSAYTQGTSWETDYLGQEVDVWSDAKLHPPGVVYPLTLTSYNALIAKCSNTDTGTYRVGHYVTVPEGGQWNDELHITRKLTCGPCSVGTGE